MAPKTRSDDPPPHAHVDTSYHISQQSSLAPTHDMLALVLHQMALINACLDAHTANTAAQRRRIGKRDYHEPQIRRGLYINR
jgi:hypothetical protein